MALKLNGGFCLLLAFCLATVPGITQGSRKTSEKTLSQGQSFPKDSETSSSPQAVPRTTGIEKLLAPQFSTPRKDSATTPPSNSTTSMQEESKQVSQNGKQIKDASRELSRIAAKARKEGLSSVRPAIKRRANQLLKETLAKLAKSEKHYANLRKLAGNGSLESRKLAQRAKIDLLMAKKLAATAKRDTAFLNGSGNSGGLNSSLLSNTQTGVFSDSPLGAPGMGGTVSPVAATKGIGGEGGGGNKDTKSSKTPELDNFIKEWSLEPIKSGNYPDRLEYTFIESGGVKKAQPVEEFLKKPSNPDTFNQYTYKQFFLLDKKFKPYQFTCPQDSNVYWVILDDKGKHVGTYKSSTNYQPSTSGTITTTSDPNSSQPSGASSNELNQAIENANMTQDALNTMSEQ